MQSRCFLGDNSKDGSVEIGRESLRHGPESSLESQAKASVTISERRLVTQRTFLQYDVGSDFISVHALQNTGPRKLTS